MSLLRDRRVAALLAAEVISSLGTQMTWLALPWFVLRTTGSPQQMTWVIIAEVLPIGVLGFWGGAIAARVGTRRTMLTCDLARAPLLAAIPLLYSLGYLPFGVLLALVAATGVFLAPYFGVQRAVVPELVGEEQHDVAYATAFFQAANRLTIFLGPPAAGLLISLIGATNILYVDAATYLVSFALVALFVHPPEVPAPETPAECSTGCGSSGATSCCASGRPRSHCSTSAGSCSSRHCPCWWSRRITRTRGSSAGCSAPWAGARCRRVRLDAHRAPHRPTDLGSVAFIFQMSSLWLLAVPGPWELPFFAMAAAGFFMSLVNAPMQALVMLRIPRDLRTQGVAAFGVFQCIGAPIGLVLAGCGARHGTTRAQC